MSPLNQRRWETFKRSRRSYYALIFFSLFFGVSLVSEFIANDKPLVIHAREKWYFPIFQNLNEKDLGGTHAFNIDYQDSYFTELLGKDAFILRAPIPYSFKTISNEDTPFPSPPSSKHLLGTDDQGRDILSRILYSFRISMLFGLIIALVSSVIGISVGIMQGYYGGKIDLFGQRFMEVWGGIPTLYLIIIISGIVPMTFWLLLGIMLLFSWMGKVGYVRIETLRVRNMEFIRAARALGVPDKAIMRRHILPNALVAVITMLPFTLNASITMLTSLDFLGFGLPPSYPSLGEIIAQGKNNLFAPWIGFSGFLTLAGMLTGLVFIGEGLRDALDPRVFLKQKA